MTTADILKKVRELEIKSKKLTNHLFTGEYHTAFKGRGMSFKEVREYEPGDDPRFIDWNVSARMGHTFSKIFEEERELSVYLLIDISASSLFGTLRQSKKDLMTEMCAVLAFSAISNNDKVGLIFFSDHVEKFIPAKKGRDHVLYMVREMLTFKSRSSQTDVLKALQFLNATTRHKSIVFVLSDFADAGYHDTLRVAAKRHDVIGVQVYDQRDEQLPQAGLMNLRDAETGQMVLLNTNDPYTRFKYTQQFQKVLEDAKNSFRKAGADLLQVATGQDYVKLLQQFFIRRA
ncbi:DUF58 domain-containing protein [Segetibacter sp.]|jgi:uncharacterized protein (DUF58 family)|uniref:DUF58 domain-containing protein n=1 Tax=Segetibacter sp. TaxID=2231182 RepID=UPI0026339898|nr:DUF58 domain-containing protein [Segetibacter sp.]MCW3078994.1 hypothetical protein [Segetibacter sp.]